MEFRALYLFFIVGCAQLQAASMQKPITANTWSSRVNYFWSNPGQVEKKKITFVEPLVTEVAGFDYEPEYKKLLRSAPEGRLEKTIDENQCYKDDCESRGFCGYGVAKKAYCLNEAVMMNLSMIAQEPFEDHDAYLRFLDRECLDAAELEKKYEFIFPSTRRAMLLELLQECLVIEHDNAMSEQFIRALQVLREDNTIERSILNHRLMQVLVKGYLEYVGLKKYLVSTSDDAQRFEDRRDRVEVENKKLREEAEEQRLEDSIVAADLEDQLDRTNYDDVD